jgi:thiol-disulfide isomerase/thioredoxin
MLLMVFVAGSVVGCGGSTPETADTGGSGVSEDNAAETQPAETQPAETQPAETQAAKPDSTEGAGNVAPAGPETSSAGPSGGLSLPADSNASETETAKSEKGGLQLPQTDLPDAGVSKPGDSTGKPSSGLQMPDVDPDAASVDEGGEASDTSLRYASWQAIEKQAKSTGKVTVVDLWSTACQPCLEEFPNLVRLHETKGDRVACIGVNVNFDGRKTKPPESYAERITGFLSAVGAGFDNYVCNTPSEDVFAAIDVPSIPVVMVFDAEGKLVKQFVDAGDTVGFKYDKDIIPLVESLL